MSDTGNHPYCSAFKRAFTDGTLVTYFGASPNGELVKIKIKAGITEEQAKEIMPTAKSLSVRTNGKIGSVAVGCYPFQDNTKTGKLREIVSMVFDEVQGDETVKPGETRESVILNRLKDHGIVEDRKIQKMVSEVVHTACIIS